MVALGLLQITVLFTFGAVILDLHLRGEAVALAAVVFVYVCCAVAVGVALTALLRTSQQLTAVGFLGATLMGALGGALVPISTLPGWTRRIAPATPQYWAMRATRDVIINSEPSSAVLLPILVLAAFTAVFVTIAIRRLRFDDTKVGWT